MIWIILAALVALPLIVVAARWSPSLARQTDRAVVSQDLGPLIALIATKPEDDRPTAFNQVVQSLWDRYQRPLAAQFITESVETVGPASIVQYWIRQVLEVEPEIAGERFDTTFLDAHYQPEVAASCGKFG